MTLLAAVAVGLLIGVILGALGGGGAILTIPVLTYAFGMGMHESSAASLVVVGVSSAVAAATHARAGRVWWGRGLVFAGVGMVGAVAGSFLARGLDPDWLFLAFGALLVVVGVLMLRRARSDAAAPTAPPEFRNPRTLALTAATGLGVGVLTGFFGVGGGFAIVPALTLVLGLSMPTAVATSLLVIALNSVAALATKLAIGVQLDWPLVGAVTAGMVVGSVVGSRLAGRLDPRLLQRGFALLLLAVAAFILISTGPALLR